MKSPITGFAEGSFGASKHQHEPIPRADAGAGSAAPCRVIVRDGEPGPDATDEERAALARALGKPFVYKESPALRRWAADVMMRKNRQKGRALGRPAGQRAPKQEGPAA